MWLFFHACPSTMVACPPARPLAITANLFILGHQHRPSLRTCFVFCSTQYPQLFIVFLHAHCWSFSQPLSFFFISSLKNNCCTWFYNMWNTFKYVHYPIWRAFPLL
jgi:hypothetical protein